MISTTSLSVAAGAFYLSYQALCLFLDSYFRKHLTVLNELEDLDKPRLDGRKIKGTVVIAGGSFSGLWTARICSTHFERIVIIEPEAWLQTDAGVTFQPSDAKLVGEDQMRAPVNKRKNVFQYTSIHGFQVLGLLALRKAFPGFDEKYTSAGGLLRPNRFGLLYSGIPHAYYEDLLPERSKTLHWCSRAFLEPLIRRCVKELCKNVDFVVGSVIGINPDPKNRSKIASVSYKLRDDDTIYKEATTLFVDCAGPSHNGLKWLAEAGYDDLPTTANIPAGKLPLSKLTLSYSPKMSYSTSFWPVDTEQIADLERIVPGGYKDQAAFFLYISSPDKGNANCAMGRYENDVVEVLCGGWGPMDLPRNPEGVIDFYRSMQGHRPMPEWVFSALEVLFRSKELATYENVRVPSCTRVLYSNAMNLPTNYLALGDAAMRVNPVYGQGLSKATMGVIILDSLLRKAPGDMKEIPSGFASKFFEVQERKVCSPLWDATKTQDYNYPTTVPVKGESLSDGAFVRWFSRSLMLAGTWDVEIAKSFNDTQMFLAPSVIFFKPSIVAKIMWEGLTHKAA